MANSDLKTFVEDRLRALNPTIDLDPGSPAQTLFIQPLITRLGTDPFETDVETFLLDALAQNHPDIIATDPSVIRDTFIKPLILFLEPFKRETQSLKRNQSLVDPSVLSDQDADALIANLFEERQSGGFATGIARAYYPNPTNCQAEITTRFFTAAGLAFFPSAPVSISAEEMIFNRSGSLFYFDVPVQAEIVGDVYNIDPGTIVGVDGLSGVVQATNQAKFKNGTSRVDTKTLLGQAQEALTERSLVTRRGATARLNDVFRGDVRAVQVVGAKDAEMQRDILVASSPGQAWLQGKVNLYQKVAYVQINMIDSSSETDAPVPGDQLYVYLDKYSYSGQWSTLAQANRFIRLTVQDVLASMSEVSPNQRSYFVRWSGSLPQGVSLPNPAVLSGGFIRKGTVQISSLPDVGPVSLQVNNGEVHLFGHSDIYVRPVLQEVSKSVISNLVDEKPLWMGVALATTAGSNSVAESPTVNYQTIGVSPGDLLTIEVGNDAGTYVVRKVTPSAILLTSNLTNTTTGLRYRITKKISFNPFEPKILKVPFGNLPANDLQTQIGSNIFQVLNPASDVLAFGSKIGDTVRLLSGSLLEDFTITAFLSGKRFQVDRQASSSNGNVTYQIFTPMQKVQLPLVRIKELLLLDSSRQSTSITIPYGDAVAVSPTSDFTSAQVKGGSQQQSGYVLPALLDAVGAATYVTGGNVAATSGDRRYSMAFDQAMGVFKAALFADGTQAEFDFGTATSSCNTFLATSEVTTDPVNYPPVDPKTGDCLTLKNGPNKGSYLIQSVRKFKYNLANGNQCWLYFIQIYGAFPVDVFRQLITFLDYVNSIHSTGAFPKVTNGAGTTIAFPDFFVSLYNSFGTRMVTALTASGAVGANAPLIQSVVNSLGSCQYEWGDPARGVLRTYFIQPTLFEMNTGSSLTPTLFDFLTASNGLVQYRADPGRYLKYELVPARLQTDADPLTYPRNDTKSGSQVNFGMDLDSVFSVGVRTGDVLGVHEETFMHGSDKTHQTAISTASGSTLVSAPSGGPNVFDPSMTEDLLFIEEGVDAGGYRIVSVIDGKNITLDRPLTSTTPTQVLSGQNAQWGFDGTNSKLVLTGAFTLSGLVGKMVTVYGIDSQYQGSYVISANPDANTIYVTRAAGLGAWPSYPATTGNAFFVVTTVPTVAPVATTHGTQLAGLRPVRIYNDIPKEYPITDVTADPTQSQVTLASAMRDGFKQPYRIFRPNLRRVSPTEMSNNQDGALFYFDTEVVSLQPQSTSNISKSSYLTIEEGSYLCQGYEHVVNDYTLSYSMRETGMVEVPTKILPLNAADTPANYISLVGAPIQISYEMASIVEQFQTFLDSPQDRVTSANMLARHFLPSYVSYDASYLGGSDPKVINQDIIDYINTLPPETPIDVSVLEKKIDDRSGNPNTPTKVLSVTHDWDRKQWAEFSENNLGGNATQLPYHGTPRVAFFIPGPSTVGLSTIPYGERINLTKV